MHDIEKMTTFINCLKRRREELQKYREGFDWLKNARPNQLPPDGDWVVWMILAGRGFGKTRSGAETIRLWVAKGSVRRIALIGKSIYEARAVMLDGESGLLNIYPAKHKPEFHAAKRQVVWPCGAVATLYGADQYEQLRGPQFDGAWIDEFAKFRHQRSLWEQLSFCLRLGSHPKCIITTTPRPSRTLEKLIREPFVVVTRGTTFENEKNLSPTFMTMLTKQFSGTQIGAQELYGELLTERAGALWRRDILHYAEPEIDQEGEMVLERIVVAIDPATTCTEESDETGIIVVGLDENKVGYVLEDLSGRCSPAEWGQRAVKAYWHYRADRIVAEVNKGGDLVERVIKSLDNTVSYKAVRATRGKAVRAEPIAALYEQRRIFHRRPFRELETQLCEYIPGETSKSPDRLDALVWGLTELMLVSETCPKIKLWKV